MSENPFQTPQKIDGPGGPGGIYPRQSLGRGYVSQVSVIGILLIVQGILLMLFGLLSIGLTMFVGHMDAFMPPGARPPQFQDQMQQTIMTWVYGIYAGVTIPLSLMHCLAGYFALNYRHRIFGIVTMILGLASMLTCYCAPTSIGLAVYGMIIFFNSAVTQAFALGDSGLNKKEILAKFPY